MPEVPSALSVAEIGSFFTGGRIHHLEGLARQERISTPGGPVHFIDPNGELMAGQMYVHYVRLANPAAAAPLLMWHGGGMTGVNWETTPDGRPGWQMFFLRAGFDTYISDAVERGRASWAPYPQVYAPWSAGEIASALPAVTSPGLSSRLSGYLEIAMP
jgi:hypothetical protein